MDKGAAINALTRFKKALEARGIRDARLVLYGSYAGGAPREGSDIDVVVVSPDFAGKDYWERVGVLSDAIYEVFEPIEATALTPEEWEHGASRVVTYAQEGEIL